MSDHSYVGVCLKDDEVTILVNFEESESLLDGYSIFRSSNIYRYCECEELTYNNDELEGFKTRLDLSKCTGFSSSLKYASELGLIAFFEAGDLDTYFVGTLISIENNICSFELIDEDGSEIGIKKIDLDSIIYFSFYTIYEIEWSEFLRNKKQQNISTKKCAEF